MDVETGSSIVLEKEVLFRFPCTNYIDAFVMVDEGMFACGNRCGVYFLIWVPNDGANAYTCINGFPTFAHFHPSAAIKTASGGYNLLLVSAEVNTMILFSVERETIIYTVPLHFAVSIDFYSDTTIAEDGTFQLFGNSEAGEFQMHTFLLETGEKVDTRVFPRDDVPREYTIGRNAGVYCGYQAIIYSTEEHSHNLVKFYPEPAFKTYNRGVYNNLIINRDTGLYVTQIFWNTLIFGYITDPSGDAIVEIGKYDIWKWGNGNVHLLSRGDDYIVSRIVVTEMADTKPAVRI